MALSGFVVIHNTFGGGEDKVTELSGWHNLGDELLEVLNLKVESWGDDTAFVESSVQINNNLSGSGVINDFEFVDISILLHASKELDDNLGYWSKENLYD